MKLKNYLLIVTLFVLNIYALFRQLSFSFPPGFFGNIVKVKRDEGLKVTKKTISFKTVLASLLLLLSFTSYTQSKTTPIPDPILSFASHVAKCPSDLEDFSEIYLCGKFDKKKIDLSGIKNVKKIKWVRTDAVLPLSPDCPDKSISALPPVKTGSIYNVDTQGSYRVVITYNDESFDTFYFNVYKNDLDPKYTSKDIICGNPGNITITSPTTGYLFSLDNTINYQSSPVFSGVAAGTHTVYIKLADASTKTCDFPVTTIDIKTLDLVIDPITYTQPVCGGDIVNAKVAVSGLPAGTQYTYTLNNKGTGAAVGGPIVTTNSNHTFSGLTVGTYEVTVETADCTVKKDVTIITSNPVTATIAQTKALTCTDGEITVYPTGGTAPFKYYVNGSTSAQYSAVIKTPTARQYDIKVVDYNGCSTTTSIKISTVPKPVTNPTATNVNCYGDTSGVINFNVTNANEYTLYSINNGSTYGTSAIISNLAAGTYNTILKYSLNGIDYCFDTMKVITITQPSAALTASGGVSELAGCGQAPFPKSYGKVRITNPQGGTPFAGVNPYLYSFDNQTTWTTVNDAYVAPGTYTLYIKDANGCIFPMPGIILDPEPVAPTVAVFPPVFNCNGSATSTVKVTNAGSSSFSYNYLLDGNVNTNTTDPKTFLNVPAGPHNIRVEYFLTSVSTYSNLLKEDFGSGAPTTTPGIAAAYCFHDLSKTPSTCVDKRLTLEDNQYEVTSAIIPNNGSWFPFRDHTSLGTNANGRFLAVNIGSAAGPNGVLYSKPIVDVIPYQPVKVDLYVANLLKVGVNAANPYFIIELVTSSGTVIATQATDIIPTSNTWILKSVSLNPLNNTSLTFNIRSGSIAYDGNDAVIDDITVYQLPKACITTKDFPITIDNGKAFTAAITGFKNVTCADKGKITIAAQNFNTVNGFQYSIDNGVNWNTQMTSPYTITGLDADTYNLQIRYDATSTGSCVKTISQTITPPVPPSVTIASVSQQATCTTGATITAEGGGGSPAYQYELRQVITGVETVITAFNNNANFTNVPAGNYMVYVRDTNLCTSVGKAISVVAPPTLTAVLDVATDYCYTTANPATLVVTVSGGVGPFTYKLDGNTPINTNAFTEVAPGTHNILVTDSNNCTATIANIDIKPQLVLTAALAQDLTCLVDASITATVESGGYGVPYTYKVSRNGGTPPETVTSFPYTAKAEGTYVFTVTDSKGCTATSNTITVTPKTTPTLTFTKTDITCNNANDGTITVTASGGFTSAYSYVLTGPLNVTQTTNQFIGLPAGTYNIKVIDSKGCPSASAVSTVTIVNPGIVKGSISATDIKCSATGTVPAVVTINGLGGTAPYKYSFNSTTNFTDANTYSTSVAGTVTAYIKDANGCQIGPLSQTIAALKQITVITITDNGYDCANPAGGHVNIAATGVSAPIRYQIISGPAGYNPVPNPDSNGEFKALVPGAYVFQATDTKTNCSLTKSYTVNGVPDIVAGGSVLTPIKCFGDKGIIQFTVTGLNSHRYDYVITNTLGDIIDRQINQSAATFSLIDLLASNYTIVVTDRTTKCTDHYTVILTQPTAALAITGATPTNVNCNNDNSQITVVATGGTTNYMYAFAKNPSTVPTSAYGKSATLTVDTNSGADLFWDVYVKDANGCTTKTLTPVKVISDAMPAITSVVVKNQCTASGSAFTITAEPSATSLEPLTYGIAGSTGAFQISPTFTVPSGSYTVSIKDANGCVVSAATPTIVYPQLTAVAAVTKTLNCYASPDAVITTTIQGGKAPYTYTVTKGTGALSLPSTASPILSFTYSVSNTDADTYTFVVTDANNCTSITTTTVNPITNPTVTATSTNVSCNGGNNGSVQLTGAGGSGGYTYSKDNVNFVTSGLFAGLKASATPYIFYVKDSKGCPGTVSATITEPTALVATASATSFSCSATNTKQSALVTIDVPTTGTAPYQYSFNGGGFTNTKTLTVNDNGTDQTINYSVKDNNGCIQGGKAVVINRLNPPTITSITHTDIYCFPVAKQTSEVTVATVNGVGTLTYEIIAPVASVTSNNDGIFNNLAGGITYTFKVTDANGCFAISSHNVPVATPIAVTATKLSDVDCNGFSTGSIRYDVSGFTTTYSYTVNDGTAVTGQKATTFILPNLGVTTPYKVVFTDETSACTAPTSIIITQPTAGLSATFTTVNANCNVPTSKVTVTGVDGTSGYKYSFVADNAVAGTYVDSNVANLDPALVWDVWVKDAKGCTFKLDLVIAKDSAPTAVTATGSGCLGTLEGYSITAAVTGGTGGLSYSINVGASYQPTNAFTITKAGTYTIRVKDANGCTFDSNTVVVAPQLTLSAILKKDITCNPAPTDAQITLTPTGGTGTFTYTSSPSTGTFVGNVFTTSTPGNYTFTVKDSATGCTYSTTAAIVVTTPVTPNITEVKQTQSINCNGEATAAISITIDNTKGQSPFVFNIHNNTLEIDYGTQTSGLRAGKYTITVTDAKGCTDTFSYFIAEPQPIDFDLTKVDITCDTLLGTSLGSISVGNVSGGTTPFKYFITNNFGDVIVGNPYSATTNENHTFTIINYGLYTVNIVDANGCSLSKQITIASPPSDLTIDVTTISSDCISGGTAIVKVISLVGSGNYKFGILETNTIPYTTNYQTSDIDFPDTKTFTNLTPGVIYTFVIHDLTTNCYYVKSAGSPIDPASSLTSTAIPNNVTCKGANDGSVTFTISNFDATTTSVDYQVFTAFSNIPLGPIVNLPVTFGTPATVTTPSPGTLAPGRYYVKFIENGTGSFNGCKSASLPFDIKESAIDMSVSALSTKNANCTDLGIISAQAKDGTAPYTYQVTSSATAPLASDASWVSGNTFTRAGTLAGTLYYVYTKDAYGCIKQNTVTVFKDEVPTITAPTPICYDGSTPFTINISGTVDPDIVGGATYSVNGSAFQASPNFTFNEADTYNLVIKDGNGCTDAVPYIVYPKLELFAALTTPLDCIDSPDAVITLTTKGGNTTPAANYTYEYSTDAGTTWSLMTTNVLTTLVTGNYIFRVTDKNNTTSCQTTTTFVLDPIPTTVFAPTVTNVSCFGGTDGTIMVNVTAGEGPYEYSLTDGVTTTAFQPSNSFTGLAAGTTYAVTVRNARNCTLASGPITVTEPIALTAISTITTPLTCDAVQPAMVTVTVTPGTGTFPYEYSFDGGANYSSTNTYQSYVGTKFDVYVKDANGCPLVLTNGVDIPVLVPPTGLTFKTTVPVTCLVNGTVEITGHTGGVGTLQYETITPSPIIVPQQTTTTFADLTPGTYLFKVTDANGCSFEESHTIAPVTNITVAGQLINDVTCNPVNNGEVLFTVGNFAGTYSYTINGFAAGVAQTATTINLTGLGIGDQVIVVTDDATGCDATFTVPVTQPDAPLTLTEVFSARVNANCDSGAKVTVLAEGGTLNYTYAFVADNATPVDTPLATDYTASASAVLPAPNNYDVWVKDNNGCTFKLDISVGMDASPTIVLPDSHCFDGKPFTIDLSVGQIVSKVPATYTINGSNQASPLYTINAPGTYQLSVVDANGCSSNVVDYIVQPQLTLMADLIDLTCPSPASITLTAAGGTTSYTTYEVMFNGVSYSVLTAPVPPFTTTNSGTYKFIVTDSQGCQAESQDVIVTPTTTPKATAIPTIVSCIGETDGTITVTPSEGILPYKYSIDGVTYQDSNVFTGLGSGSYSIVVRDAKMCLSNAITVAIGQPTPVKASAMVTPFGCDTSNAPQDAIVTITPGGGTPGVGTPEYTYSFDGGTNWQASPSFSVNTAQTINYVVRDANGCSAIGSVPVLPYTPPTDMNIIASPIYCNTSGTAATVTVNAVTGGVEPYNYEIISPPAAVTAPDTTNSFANLAPDTYIIKVTDSNGCSTIKAIVVEEADKISVTAQLINDVYCNGGSTGAVDFTVANYIAADNYTFGLSSNVGTMTQNGDVVSYTALPQGNYTFTVTDKVSGCVASVTDFPISGPMAALDFTATATNINCNNNNATITVTPSGGTAPYKYAVVPASAPAPTAYVLSDQLVVDTNNGADINWVVYVTDANGCQINKPQKIVLDTNPTIDSAVETTPCPNLTGTYDITVTANGFGTLQYSADGSNYQTGNVITVNAPGPYTITVKDANGCISTITKVTISDPLILTPTVTSSPSCVDFNGVVAVATTGGSTNYSYNIDGGAFGATTPFAGVAAGTHTIGVRDTAATTVCEVYVPITLTPATPITGFTLGTTPVTCNGGTDGVITATMAMPTSTVNNNPVYTYVLSGTTVTGTPVNVGPQDSPLFSGLEAGNYTVTVTSERGCPATLPITVDQPDPIVPNPTVVQFGCTPGNAANFATITIDPSAIKGGSGTYLNYEFIKIGTPNTQVQFGASNTYTEANLTGGTYIVNAYDSKGCMGTTTATIDPFVIIDAATLKVKVDNAITCANPEDITVSVNTSSPATLLYSVEYVNGGAVGYVYSEINKPTDVFEKLAIGNYLITVTNPTTGCSVQTVHYVNEPNTFDLTIDNVVDVTCFNGNNGSVNVTFIDRVISATDPDQAGPFSYTVVDVLGNTVATGMPTADAGPITISSLAAGTYMITATLSQSPSCPVTKNFTITRPTSALDITETHTEITCDPGNDGTISVSATGGWPGGYEFQLELGTAVVTPWSTVTNFTGLAKGDYTVSVRDSKDPKGCIFSKTIPTLKNPVSISKPFINATSVLSLSCKGDTKGSIIVDVPAGGQGSNYWYTLNTVPASVPPAVGQLSPEFTGLGAGTYTVTVTDGWGCSSIASDIIEITEPKVLTAGLVIKTIEGCIQQPEITLTATGGNGTYSYSMDGITNWTSFESPVTFTNLPKTTVATTYSYFVQDSNGCTSTVSNSIEFFPVAAVSLFLDLSNAKIICSGDKTASIVATAQGGLGNYVYTLTDNTGAALPFEVTQTTPGVFTDLPKGNYLVTVTSGDCATSKPADISEPADKFSATFSSKPVSCNGGNDGSIIITPSGGTAKYQYSIDPPDARQTIDKNTFVGLRAGFYNVYAQDANGCPFPVSKIEITEPDPISATTTILKEEICFGDKDGAFSINITGGTAPYKVSLDDPNGTYTSVIDFTGLSGGNHVVYIQDSIGCTTDWTVALPESIKLDPIAIVDYDCVNNVAASIVTVKVDASITNSADVDYALDGSTSYQLSNVFINVAPGTHHITTRHTNGCEKVTANFEILQIAPLQLALNDGGLNEIVATATGGGGNYQYTLNGESYGSQSKFIIYKSGDYAVTVTDKYGCQTSATRYFEFIDIKIPNVFTPNGDGINDGWAPTNTINYPDLVFHVFDRYGRRVATFGQGQAWDGKYNGLELPSGDYWFILKLQNAKDAREFMGHFTLYR